jgi:hypothetical protein
MEHRNHPASNGATAVIPAQAGIHFDPSVGPEKHNGFRLAP